MAATAFEPLTKGEPYGIVFKVRRSDGSFVDFATTPAYLVLASAEGYRKRLKWVPGDGDNDGAPETIGGISHMAFRLPAEWTRVADNLPNGSTLGVFVHLGALTGNAPLGKRVGSVTVQSLDDGLPME